NPRRSHIWDRRWTGREAVARQNRNDRARQVGTSSRLSYREFVVGGYRFLFVANRPISDSVLFLRFARRLALIGRIRKTPGENGERPPAGRRYAVRPRFPANRGSKKYLRLDAGVWFFVRRFSAKLRDHLRMGRL